MFLYALDLFGVAVFAASGALAGVGAQFDLLGVLVLASITAVGGGVVRDVLSAKVPLILRHEIYASAAIAGIVVYLLLRAIKAPTAAAFAAGFFTVAGTRLFAIAYDLRLPVFVLPQ